MKSNKNLEANVNRRIQHTIDALEAMKRPTAANKELTGELTVQVVVTVKVSPNDENTHVSEEAARMATRRAIYHAIEHFEENGFSHPLEKLISIELVDVGGVKLL